MDPIKNSFQYLLLVVSSPSGTKIPKAPLPVEKKLFLNNLKSMQLILFVTTSKTLQLIQSYF